MSSQRQTDVVARRRPGQDDVLLPARRFEPDKVGCVDRDHVGPAVAVDVTGRDRVADPEVAGNLFGAELNGGGRRLCLARLGRLLADTSSSHYRHRCETHDGREEANQARSRNRYRYPHGWAVYRRSTADNTRYATAD